MAYGYNGKILRVDLTERRWEIEEPGEAFYRRYLGGGALAAYYLLKEMPAGCDPLGPENVLVFAPAVMTGTPASGMVRYTVAAKSPLTGGYGESEAGGYWGPELKFAGFDAVVIKGRSSEPVYLWVHDGGCEFRPAEHLRGMLSDEAEETIQAELGDAQVRVAQAGPAGEKLVRFAAVVNNLRHFNGRTGMGAVMASKNLRAVAVRGKQRPALADPEAVKGLARWFIEQGAHPFRDLGTTGNVLGLDAAGILPTRNFEAGSLEGAEGISGERMNQTILVKRGSCWGCSVHCKREVSAEAPYRLEPKYGGPEYEALGAFGSLCGVSDLSAVAAANQLCNSHVTDCISTGVSVAFAMECFERGILTTSDTDGLDLRFGNAEAMLKLTERIVKREGLGDVLAEGVARAARQIGKGAEEFAMHVKGQELPLHDPRGKASLALAFALSPTGADHLEAAHDPALAAAGPNLERAKALGIYEPMPARALDTKKARNFSYLQHVWSAYNAMGVCIFVSFPTNRFWTSDNLLELVRAATGWNMSLWELLKAGERATTMARLFNVREGFTPADDRVPERLYAPLKAGHLKGAALEREKLEAAIRDYYGIMGWDPATGVPTAGKLAELGIEELG